MIGRGDRVGVAVSGGKDSLSLLLVLHELARHRGWNLVALSVDEGVAGYRDEALANARSVTEKLGVEHIAVSYEELYGFSLDQALDWKEERPVSSCSFCGVFRRRAIDDAAARAGASVVATAHNLDDQVQTFILNLLHGDVDRLPWLNPAHSGEDFPIRRVKPFMEIYEEEVALFAYLSGIPFQTASCPYMHEGLRSEVRDWLNQMEAGHPGMKHVLLKSTLGLTTGLDSRKPSAPCTQCGRQCSGGVCGVCRLKAAVSNQINYGKDARRAGGG
jgi:cytoplasmic tRNA 2-thiolation protein 1